MSHSIHPGPTLARKTADQNETGTALVDCTDLVFSVAANARYWFLFGVIFNSASLVAGLKTSVSGPAGSSIAAHAIIPTAPDGVSAMFEGHITASDDVVISVSVQATATDYYAQVSGIIVTGANAGNLQLRFASSLAATQIQVKANSCGMLQRII